MTIAEIIEAKKRASLGPCWTAAAKSSRATLTKLEPGRKPYEAPTEPIRLTIIDSEAATAALIEAAGMQAATTEADAQAVAKWLETKCSTLECASSGRVFLPLDAVAILENDSRAFLIRVIAERKRTEAEAAGKKIMAAAARRGIPLSELLAAIDQPAEDQGN